jgi:hypothetical protein
VCVGQRVGLTTNAGAQPVTIVGVFTFGNAASIGGATVVETTLRDAQRRYDRVGLVSKIVVAADRGVTPTALVRPAASSAAACGGAWCWCASKLRATGA